MGPIEPSNSNPYSCTQKSQETSLRRATTRYCDYCGAPLDPRTYFCLACAKPYKNAEMVLSRPVPKYLSDNDLIQKKAPHAWGLFWIYLGTVLALAIGCHLLFFEQDAEAMALIVSSIGFALVTFILAVRHWRTLVASLKSTGLLHWQSWAGLAMLVPLLAINYVYHGWLETLGGERGIELVEELRQQLGPHGILILFAIVPAVTEEIGFRGLLQSWLCVAIRPWKGVVLAAALFTALHFTLLSAWYLFAVGMLLGWVKRSTGSLYPPIVLHGVHNFIVVTYFYHA